MPSSPAFQLLIGLFMSLPWIALLALGSLGFWGEAACLVLVLLAISLAGYWASNRRDPYGR